ncbi:hypothetical protein SAMN05216228_101364 [Rhizobium tibeticum]|uniref:Uncharacterized protein n=1 Tax=Rhizobium tibeticum TaxID=501024 RepID=A0A1H8MU84_9HYPH|nr:hypothetical protein RTCCBAU85039_4678 [Rhizobium tibeticum]SEO20839.1 hypothetical protein SAMN05216228_101364 [Rhizobium tibeticum]
MVHSRGIELLLRKWIHGLSPLQFTGPSPGLYNLTSGRRLLRLHH